MEAPAALPSYLLLLVVMSLRFPASLPNYCVAAEQPREVKRARKFFSQFPKAFKISAEIEIECELYGCLGKFPPQGRTLRQTS